MAGGFVYVWFDRKRRRFYVGSHWGAEDDGYVCSSSWMKKAQKLRPTDFRRRVVARVATNRADLFTEEHRWLSMIKDHELRSRYYNIQKHAKNHWHGRADNRSVREKISATLKGRPDTRSAETLAKIAVKNRERLLGSKVSPESLAKRRATRAVNGVRFTEEGRAAIRATHLGNKNFSLSPETRAKQSAAHRNISPETRAKMRAAKLGVKQPEETIAKKRAALIGGRRSEETRAKLSAARRRTLERKRKEPPMLAVT